jgi:hypothetical protein
MEFQFKSPFYSTIQQLTSGLHGKIKDRLKHTNAYTYRERGSHTLIHINEGRHGFSRSLIVSRRSPWIAHNSRGAGTNIIDQSGTREAPAINRGFLSTSALVGVPERLAIGEQQIQAALDDLLTGAVAQGLGRLEFGAPAVANDAAIDPPVP